MLFRSLTDGATTATFKVAAGALDAGKKVTIGGKEYTIGSKEADVKALIKAPGTGEPKNKVTIDGTDYEIDDQGAIYKAGNGTALKKNELPGGTADTAAVVADLQALVKAGAKVSIDGKDYTIMKDEDGNNIDDADSSVITATKAVELMTTELTTANNIGATKIGRASCRERV